MPAPNGFAYQQRTNGDVVVTHHGRVATILRHAKAAAFLDDVGGLADAEVQELMARVTGNYRRGNERLASQHPRHRRR